ncbi:MAG: tRNA 2-thiouridine(34) synthase MnmA [bacterium]|nr:tRNA 2-thiouridine(34) synthase MnmA [bacterium]
MKSQGNQKVYLGMSGGVDSSVSAALLKKAGYNVTGVFIKVWQPDWLTCTWKEDRRDAMRVAAHLGIPFVTLDLEAEYKKDVVDYMISEYKIGRTPNPDVMCNKSVKFGAFYDWAMKQGANFVATGHYAQIKKIDETLALQVSTDLNKDQSYFIWNIKPDQLDHILFPVGHLEKPEVRVLAQKFELPNATKKDSQGLCFIGKVDMKEFLSHYIETTEGSVLNEKGEVIGLHPGALLFTIGERRGFTITKKTPHDQAFYVLSKNTEKNEIVVGSHINEPNSRNYVTSIDLIQTNWIGKLPRVGAQITARSRYRQPLEKVTVISVHGSEVTLKFETPQETIAPGQSLVMYDKDICLGGGIINEAQ